MKMGTACHVFNLMFTASLLVGSGYAILSTPFTFTANPANIQETETKSVTMVCTPGDVNGDASSSSTKTIYIVKDGVEHIASLAKCSDSTSFCPHRFSDEIQAVSTTTSGLPTLTVTIPDPTPKFSGVYSCVMNYVDSLHFLKEVEKELTVTVKAFTAKDLKPTVKNLIDSVRDLRTFKNPDCYSAFAYTTKAELSLTTNSDLILPDAIVESGSGYNSTTGVFTAPCNGLYYFHLTVRVGLTPFISKNGDYYLAVKTKMTFTQARNYCKNLNNAQSGYIAAPRNAAENEFLRSISPVNDYWIGISDATTEGTWVREDGEPLSWTFWDGGQPSGGINQNYGEVWNNAGEWNDEYPHRTNPFICVTRKLVGDEVATFAVQKSNQDVFKVQASLSADKGSAGSSIYLDKDDTIKVRVVSFENANLIPGAFTVFSGHLVTKLE